MGLGSVVVIPLTNPASVPGLVRMAALVAAPDGGTLVPLTVVPTDVPSAQRNQAHDLVRSAERHAADHGVDAAGIVATSDSVPDAVIEAVEERAATLVLMGWQGRSTHLNVFGALIDSVVGRSSVPLGVARIAEAEPSRVLLPVSGDHLLPAGSRGVALAAALVRRVVAGLGLPVLVLRTGGGDMPLSDEVAVLSDRVHHDPRAVDVAVGAATRPGDVVVVPVAPTASGLRVATTHVAWAAPDATVLVAIDVGPTRSAGVAEAVAGAGGAPPVAPAGVAGTYHIRVEVEGGAATEVLAEPLADIGAFTGDRETGGVVAVEAASANAALALVMDALDHAPALEGARIRYEIAPA